MPKLNIGLMSILKHIYIGQGASDIKNGLCKFSVDQHWVFYEIKEEDIIMHAFLHSRQNPDIHLKV